jgi:hypothetical protein
MKTRTYPKLSFLLVAFAFVISPFVLRGQDNAQNTVDNLKLTYAKEYLVFLSYDEKEPLYSVVDSTRRTEISNTKSWNDLDKYVTNTFVWSNYGKDAQNSIKIKEELANRLKPLKENLIIIKKYEVSITNYKSGLESLTNIVISLPITGKDYRNKDYESQYETFVSNINTAKENAIKAISPSVNVNNETLEPDIEKGTGENDVEDDEQGINWGMIALIVAIIALLLSVGCVIVLYKYFKANEEDFSKIQDKLNALSSKTTDFSQKVDIKLLSIENRLLKLDSNLQQATAPKATMAAPFEAKAPAMPPPPPTISEYPKTKYAIYPDKENGFSKNVISDTPKEYESIYELTLHGERNATFKLSRFSEAKKSALQANSLAIERACTAEGNAYSAHTIDNIDGREGQIELNGDLWVITRKAHIKYIESN